MAKYNKLSPSDAIRSLADYTEKIRIRNVTLCSFLQYQYYFGSMPVYTDEVLYNVSYLLRRDGTWEEQYKIHVTLTRKIIGSSRWKKLRIFETDVMQDWDLICFDVEFPNYRESLQSKK